MANQRPPSDKLPKQQANSKLHHNQFIRLLYIIAGVVFIILGIIGIIVPGMPTTVFIILAAWSWAKGSERFHHWLINHKLFGQSIKNWEENRAMPLKAKYLAWLMMTLSCIILWFRLPDELWWVALSCSIFCLAVAIWMYRLPNS